VTSGDDHSVRLRLFGGSLRRSSGVIAMAEGAIVTLICWYFGLDAWRAVTFGAVAGSASLFYAAWPNLREVQWHDARPARVGARHDISWLAASLRPRYGRVGEGAVRALRALATHRLAVRHLDLTKPDDQSEIERLIGRHAYAALRPQRRWKPTYRSVVRCLDALDGLDPAEENHDR
jgi:hypothetical protein